MSEYINYKDNMRGFSDFASDVQMAVFDHYQRQINDAVAKEYDSLYSAAQNDYVNAKNKDLNYYGNMRQQKENELNKGVDSSGNPLTQKQIDSLNNDISQIDSKVARINNGLNTYNGERTAYVFETKTEMNAVINALNQNEMFVSAITDKIDGKYALLISSNDEEQVCQYMQSQNIVASRHEPEKDGTSLSKAMKDINNINNDLGGDFVSNPMQQSIRESEAGQTQANLGNQIDFARAVLNAVYAPTEYQMHADEWDTITKETDALSNLGIDPNGKLQTSTNETFHSFGNMSAQDTLDVFNVVKLKTGTDIIKNNDSASVFNARQRILDNHRDYLTYDKKGQLDISAMEKLDDTIMSKEEKAFIKATTKNPENTYGHGHGRWHTVTTTVVGFAVSPLLKDVFGGVAAIQDAKKAKERATQTYRAIKSNALFFTKNANKLITRININKKATKTDKPLPLKNKDAKADQRVFDKRNKEANKNNSRSNQRNRAKFDKHEKKLQKKYEKREKRKAKRDLKWQAFAQKYPRIAKALGIGLIGATGVGKVVKFLDPIKGVRNLLNVTQQIKNKIMGIIMSAFGTLLLLSVFSLGGYLLFSFIVSFFNGDGNDEEAYKNTVMYHIVEDMMEAQDKWVEQGKNTDGIWNNRDTLAWGENYEDINTYLNSGKVKNSTYEDGQMYINPFNFEPADRDAKKQVDEIDDANWSVTPAEDSDHTSNIKDIVCMTDVMYSLDVDSWDDETAHQSLNDSVVKFEVTNYLNNQASKWKKIGDFFTLGKLNLSDDTTDTVSYTRIKQYALGLFDASHQEQIDLEVNVYPINTTDANSDDACPDAEKGGCAEYDGFVYKDNITSYDLSLLGTDGLLHEVGEVTLDENEHSCIETYWDDNLSSFDDMKFYHNNNGCWTVESTTSNIFAINPQPHATYDRTLHQFKLYTYVSTGPKATGEKTPFEYNDPSDPTKITGGGTDVTAPSYDETIETWTWNCQGHKGHYCGGHVDADVSGVVYTFTRDQIEANKEDSDGTITYEPKLENVDYSSPTTAYNSGLNISVIGGVWASPEVSQILGANWKGDTDSIAECKDLFDVDLHMLYGSTQFPVNGNYKLFESWTEDNMWLALNKYSQDWDEIYGFDIPTNVGCGSLTESDIKKIMAGLKAHYGDTVNETRWTAVELALRQVGAASYKMEHTYMYLQKKPNGMINTTTDCSGFASFILYGHDRIEATPTLTPYTMISSHDEMLPADCYSITNGTSNSDGCDYAHALVFIGYLDEDIELSNGNILSAGYPMTCDCTTLDGGNIFLRNAGPNCGYGAQSWNHWNDTRHVHFDDSRNVDEYKALFQDHVF